MLVLLANIDNEAKDTPGQAALDGPSIRRLCRHLPWDTKQWRGAVSISIHLLVVCMYAWCLDINVHVTQLHSADYDSILTLFLLIKQIIKFAK